jgi:Phosphotransferase enzyme family
LGLLRRRGSIEQFGIVRRLHAFEISWRSGEGKAKMQASEVSRAVAAAMSTASALDLTVDDAIVLHDSNKLALRLLPCGVLARVAPVAHQVAQFEVDLAQRLAETESPVAALEPRVEPRVYERDGFVVTLWTYYEPVTLREVSPADYANALERLHAGMRKLDVTTPHFTDRVAEAQQLVASRDHTPALADPDRELLSNTLRGLRRAIGDRSAAEQLLHGEPHPGNVLSTKNGLLFIDLETCCCGPVEFDLAHVPEEVSERYPDADQELLRECRIIVLAMVAAWRWDPGDQFPNGQRAARELLTALREGPPWPTLDVVMRRLGGP